MFCELTEAAVWHWNEEHRLLELGLLVESPALLTLMVWPWET